MSAHNCRQMRLSRDAMKNIPTSEELRARIREVFRLVPRPEYANIVEHSCPECDELREDLAQLGQYEVPNDVLDYHRNDLSLFSPEALRYFLPAYLIYSIEKPDSDLTEYVIFFLCSYRFATSEWKNRVRIFSESEKEMVCLYLHYLQSQTASRGYMTYLRKGEETWCRVKQGPGG